MSKTNIHENDSLDSVQHADTATSEKPSADILQFRVDPFAGDAETLLKQAHISGKDSPEWQALLNRVMTLLLPQDLKRDAGQTQWKNSSGSLRAWLMGSTKGGLIQHLEREKKGYFPVVFGAAAKAEGITARKNEGMKTVEFVGLDSDAGDSFADALDAVEAEGWAVIGYTSFNHLTKRSRVKRDEVLKHFKAERDITNAEMREYLEVAGKLRQHVIDTVEIETQSDHDEDGVAIVITHKPLEKWRMLFPLETALTVTKLHPVHKTAREVYKQKVLGLAKRLGLKIDEACLEVARAFYMPSHPTGAEYSIEIIRGRGLTLDELPAVAKSGLDDPFSIAGAGADKEVAQIAGMSAMKWAAKYGPRLRIAELLKDHAPDHIRKENGDIVVVECPFDASHSNAGDAADTGCHVEDAYGEKAFVWKCKHGCKATHDRLDMVMKAIADEWFAPALLIDEAYLEPLSNEDLAKEEAYARGMDTDESRFEPVASWMPWGYEMEYGTIWKTGKPATDDDGDSVADTRVQLCQAFNAVGRASNLAGDASAGRMISFKNENGVEVEKTLQNRDLINSSGGGVLEDLADAGMLIYARSRKDRESLLNLFTIMKLSRHIPTIPRPGWNRDGGGNVIGFMTPAGQYIAAETSKPYRLATAATMRETKTAGTLDGYKKSANAALTHTENFYWGFSVSAAFAGPLLSLADLPACGYNLSGDSSKGKSLALLLGCAAWGATGSKQGVFFKMNATTNAMEDLATVGSETFMGCDEIGMMQNPRDLPAILFTFAEMSGKSRKSGRGKGLAEDAEYRPFIAFTNERSLRTVVQDSGGDFKTGLAVRFPDISVTDGKTVTAAEIAVLEDVTRNYGHAGPAFVQWLIAEGWHKRGAELRKRIDKAASDLSGNGTPAQGRAAKVFALVQIGGELACEAGILDDKEQVKTCVQKAWSVFASSDEGKATEGESSLVDGFRSWLVASMGVSLLSIQDHDLDAKIFRERKGWYTKEEFILIADALDMKAMGLNGTKAGLLKALNEIGALVQSGKNNAHNKLPAECGGGLVGNYRVDRGKLGV